MVLVLASKLSVKVKVVRGAGKGPYAANCGVAVTSFPSVSVNVRFNPRELCRGVAEFGRTAFLNGERTGTGQQAVKLSASTWAQDQQAINRCSFLGTELKLA